VISAQWKLKLWNWYPPFLGAGIKIEEVAEDYSYLIASLTLRWWNKNYIGTLFGGAIYSLCDPFHAVLLMHRLAPDFVVRDKGGDIRFLKKGTEKVWARFEVSAQVEREIRENGEEVFERKFPVSVKTRNGEVVAEVTKVLHFRRIKAKEVRTNK